ncbi:CRISPR-associated protein Cas4 [Microtetraspora fusca]|uniref:CRISPR-associated exonuclease Cas4 n=1 Tax=Microtetraspora fusca TaxID=1997 RepID=A0ABW6V3S6_MICFU
MTTADEADGGIDEPVSIPLSALEHVTYCRRQAALIHVEATWADSVDTVRGDLAHAAVDLPGTRRRRDVIAVRSLPVRSRVYGLHGVCDLVEIRGEQATPVEYKVGPYHPDGPADVQLAGQATCLAEAGYAVPVGYIYSAADRKRHEVPIAEDLVNRVREAIARMRALLVEDRLPAAHNDRRCRRCSLRDDCMPELTHTRNRAIDLFTIRPLGAWRD